MVNITDILRSTFDWRFANPAEVAERFWRKVGREPGDACWLWRASVFGTGYDYGQFVVRQQGRRFHLYAHRVAWMLTHGAIPAGLNVCHRCDVPLCVNPSHLFLGTQGDNIRDAFAKGRHPKLRRGFKLSIAERMAIRAQLIGSPRGTAAQLARRHRVSKTVISRLSRHTSTVNPTCAIENTPSCAFTKGGV